MRLYEEKARSIIMYFEDYIKGHYPQTYTSHNDYRVISDELGGGISIELQWDGDPTEEEIATVLEDHFKGLRCRWSWGRWEHQATVTVDERECWRKQS